MTAASPANGGPSDLADDPLPTLLLVDDEAPIRHALRREMRAKKIRVIEASSAQEVYALLDGPEPPALCGALLDYYMPKIDGISLAEALRLRFEGVPILLVTAGHLQDDARVREAVERGLIWGILPKPWNRSLLLEAVDHLVSGQGPPEDLRPELNHVSK